MIAKTCRTLMRCGSTALVFAACSGDSTAPPEVGSVSITAPQTNILIGGTVQLAATILNTSGAVMPGQVTWTSSEADVAAVSAAGVVSGLAVGTTVVTATAGGQSATVEINVRAGACTTATSGSIALGDSRTGTLNGSECILLAGPQAAGWSLTLTTRSRVFLEMTSPDFDPFVTLTDASLNLIAYDIEATDGPPARVLLETDAGGYVVWVSSYNGTPGAFSLSARAITEDTCTDMTGSLAPGEDVTGTLALSDCMVEQGGYVADGWQFTLADSTTVQLDMTSSEVDAYMLLVSGDELVAFNDDAAENTTDARISARLPPGTYTLWATTYAPVETGAYAVAMQASGAAPAVVAASGFKSLRRPHPALGGTTSTAVPGRWPAAHH